MPQSSGRAPSETVLPSDSLIVDGEWSAAACGAAALSAVMAHAGPDMRVTSFSLEMTPAIAAPGAEVLLTTRTEKRTPTVAFVALEAACGGVVAFSARGLFNVRRD